MKTCNECANFSACDAESKTDYTLSHRMWLIGFWENADERCAAFKQRATGSETCVSCGDEIPEGRMVCPKCEKESDNDA